MAENFPKLLTNTTDLRISENIGQDKYKIKQKHIYTHTGISYSRFQKSSSKEKIVQAARGGGTLPAEEEG